MESKALSISIKKIITLETTVFALAFLIPLLFNGSQIITGSIINTLLFISAVKLSKRILPFLAVIPSLGAVSHGVLFGPFTIYLVYFLPFIWLGNLILMYISGLKQKTILSFITAAFAKSIFLYCIAYMFVSFHVVPKIFLTAMGVLQLVTALVGGIAAIGISKYILKPTNE
ncbi:hypothetical protein KKB64_00835 [Patescibacteria group bacterium]|nr:hypothetical protein [Patescibacteria group bacterium]MBU1472319.1 hypothetical protein [Patescibacteria group bacterium]MBU2460429.1 hypothetical protein [Patescibacteria group bacterium]MBU2544248.1 hypothetical protein [Patescibacteria group bacterium]